MTYCYKCGNKIEDKFTACSHCGSAIQDVDKVASDFCQNCGARIPLNSNFCTNCGIQISKATNNKPNEPYNETERPNPISSSILFFKDTVDYKKRLGRADFWWGYITLLLYELIAFSLLVGLATDSIMPEEGIQLSPYSVLAGLLLVFILIYQIWFILAMISARVRRLHDIGYSGAFVLLMFIPIAHLALTIMMFLPSKQHRNKYIADN